MTDEQAIDTAKRLLAYAHGSEDPARHAADLARVGALLTRRHLRSWAQRLRVAEMQWRALDPRPPARRWCVACGAELHGPQRQRTCGSRCRAAAWRGAWLSPVEAELQAQGLQVADCWRTPPALLGRLEQEWGPVILDAASVGRDAVAKAWVSPTDNALLCDWRLFCPGGPGWVWLNPPYSVQGGGLLAWMRVAALQAEVLDRRVVVLAPPGIGSTYRLFAEARAGTIRHLRRRVRFLNPITLLPGTSPRDGSSLFVFWHGSGPASVESWDWA